MNPQGVPKFSKTKDGIIVSHKEMFGIVYGSEGYASTTWDVNPANASLFPWLSTLADSYSKYHFKGLVVAYKSTSAQAVGTTDTALGRIGLATSYDVLQPPFVSMQALEAHEYSNSGKPADDVLHGIECAANQEILRNLFVTTASQRYSAEGEDERFHDLGQFQFATEGMQDVNAIGEMWVTYEIEFFVNRLPVANHGFSHYALVGTDISNPLGFSQEEFKGGTVDLSFESNSIMVFEQPGDYILNIYADAQVGNVVTSWNLTLGATGSWTTAPDGFWSSAANFYMVSGYGNQASTISYAFRIDELNTRLVLGYVQSGGAGISDMIVIKLPSGTVGPPSTFDFLSGKNTAEAVSHVYGWRDRPRRRFGISHVDRKSVGPNSSTRELKGDRKQVPLSGSEFELLEVTPDVQQRPGQTGAWLNSATRR